MSLDDALLEEIVRRVLTVSSADRIILYGSAATGRMTQHSDIDLLIVEPNPPDTWERAMEIGRAIGSIGYPLDVHVMPTARFEDTKYFVGGLAFPANKYGRVLYARA